MQVSRHSACRRDSGTPGTLVSQRAAAATASRAEQHTMLDGPSAEAEAGAGPGWVAVRVRGAVCLCRGGQT